MLCTWLNWLLPSMLFVPCKGGISHNPAEYADNEDICLAIEILAEAVKEEASA